MERYRLEVSYDEHGRAVGWSFLSYDSGHDVAELICWPAVETEVLDAAFETIYRYAMVETQGQFDFSTEHAWQ